MKILITVSTLFTLFFSSMIGYAVFINETIKLEAEITVHAPVPVVYKLLKDHTLYNQWSPMIKNIQCTNDPEIWITTYQFASKSRTITEKIHSNARASRIHSTQLTTAPGALISGISNDVSVRSLADGTTVVIWKLQYSVLSIGACLLNPIFIRPQMQKTLNQNLTALGKFIER